MKHTEKFLKQRKFMMMLPVLVLPFITLMFWALGGGKGSAVQAMPVSKGLNAKLPEAQFEAEREEDLWDKFSLYEAAARDSAAYETARENDPYFDLIAFESKQGKPTEDESKLIGTFKRKDRLIDPNEAKVNAKLQELYQEINRASNPESSAMKIESDESNDPQFTADVSRLESMMEQLNDDQEDADPEMKQLNSMLEKLMDVQHPERVRERMKSNNATSEPQTFPVKLASILHESFLGTAQPVGDSTTVQASENGFYDLDDTSTQSGKAGNAIVAIVHETQEIVTGASIRLRLVNDVTINNTVVPKDNFVYGVCSINGERLLIDITSVLVEDNLIPVGLSVYDLTGLEGIYIPGAISRDAAKQATDDAIQGVQLMSMDQSIEAQAASAGIEATKGLLSKKTKLIKVTVKAGHKVFLINKDSH